MKVATVIGARPQFIKAAVVSKELTKKHTEIIIHTGQHYDDNMSEIFFRELEIPKPNYNLNINDKSHGQMTGEMIIELEKLFIALKPDIVLVYGDTNSTISAALAAAKLYIPICHVEAGNRLNTLSNPEEINRVLTDRISSLLLCCVESSVANLEKEGFVKGVEFVGDPMYDAFIKYSNIINISETKLKLLNGEIVNPPSEYYLLTCHREENTNEAALSEVLLAMQSLDAPVIYPVHPRVKKIVDEINNREAFTNILFINPVGYLDSVTLVKNAKKIITDSGGLQREAFFAQVQCVTIFDYVAWPETMIDNRNQLSPPNKEIILEKLSTSQKVNDKYKPFGNGDSSVEIISCMESYFEKRNGI